MMPLLWWKFMDCILYAIVLAMIALVVVQRSLKSQNISCLANVGSILHPSLSDEMRSYVNTCCLSEQPLTEDYLDLIFSFAMSLTLLELSHYMTRVTNDRIMNAADVLNDSYCMTRRHVGDGDLYVDMVEKTALHLDLAIKSPKKRRRYEIEKECIFMLIFAMNCIVNTIKLMWGCPIRQSFECASNDCVSATNHIGDDITLTCSAQSTPTGRSTDNFVFICLTGIWFLMVNRLVRLTRIYAHFVVSTDGNTGFAARHSGTGYTRPIWMHCHTEAICAIIGHTRGNVDLIHFCNCVIIYCACLKGGKKYSHRKISDALKQVNVAQAKIDFNAVCFMPDDMYEKVMECHTGFKTADV